MKFWGNDLFMKKIQLSTMYPLKLDFYFVPSKSVESLRVHDTN